MCTREPTAVRAGHAIELCVCQHITRQPTISLIERTVATALVYVRLYVPMHMHWHAEVLKHAFRWSPALCTRVVYKLLRRFITNSITDKFKLGEHVAD